jgi:hypothetical protein
VGGIAPYSTVGMAEGKTRSRSVVASRDRHTMAATTALTDSPPTAPSYNLRLFLVYTHRCTRYNAEAH